MEIILVIAKWMLGIEIVITISFIALVYIIKLYQVLTSHDGEKLFDEIEAHLKETMNSGRELTRKDKKLLSKAVLVTLKIARHFDAEEKFKQQWEPIRTYIINSVMLPIMRKYYKSRKVYKRYYAAHLFYYYYTPEDAPKVISLIKDPALIISIEASRLGFRMASSELVNASIDVFAKYRRLQQSVFSLIATDCHEEVETIIFERIANEKNPYIKAFCYKLLLRFPAVQDHSEQVQRDLDSETLELRLAALNYSAHNRHSVKLLPKFLVDKQWQMRSTAAKMLGIVKDKTSIEALGNALKDPEWWVRIRAAESLKEMGADGIKVLEKQSPEIDKYAYEAAIQVLMNEKKKDVE